MFVPKFNDNGNIINTDELKREVIRYNKTISINIDNPKTILDKINWLKVYDVNNTKAIAADKVLVHEYCKEKLGKDICVPIIKTYEKAEDININLLPTQFVLKCNHGWNMNIACSNKFNFDVFAAKLKLAKWVKTDFGVKSLLLHYSLIKPMIFAEEYIGNENEPLVDYKFWCFNGEPKFYTINSDNGHNNSTDIIYRDINTDEEIEVYEKTSKRICFEKPSKFNEMLEYAKIFANEHKFIRVDFYQVDDTVYLSELTFTPGNGYMKYKNNNISIMLGNMLKLN